MRQSRRAFLRAAAASSTLVALSVCGVAPAPPRVYRVGWLLLATQAASKTQIDAFRQAMRSAVWAPTRWAPNGFAAIPTTALDPPHRAASPAVPALIGSGSPSVAASNWPRDTQRAIQSGPDLPEKGH